MGDPMRDGDDGSPPTKVAEGIEATDFASDSTALTHLDGPSSPSQNSEKQWGNTASSTTTDHVFPIRSAISVDTSQTQTPFPGSGTSPQQEYFPHIDAVVGGKFAQRTPPKGPLAGMRGRPQDDRYGGGARMNLFSSASSDKSAGRTESLTNSVKGADTASVDADSANGLYTARFKHTVTPEGHAVITGRDGETLQRCEDEPISTPGAVQGFGLLIALRELPSGQLEVRVVSENAYRLIGYTPQELFRLDNFCDILSEEQQENLLDHIDFIRDEEPQAGTNGPELFTIAVRPPKANSRTRKMWCAMHINQAHPDLIICEFELADDQMYPLAPPEDELPETPEDTLQTNPTEDEFAESTQALSKPLRVLRSARRRKGEAAAMDVFNVMSQIQEQLAEAANLESFLKILVGVIRELTGFDRCMIYQFDSAFNGRVVTELVNPRATKDLYKGLNFPASDIPKQARDLYKLNKVRLLYDRDLETARLVCRTIEDLETPLDLSYAYLRAMSPIHIKYLANMAVRSSMSISINAFGDLWGLVACHGYGPKGRRVSFPIRKMCRLIGDTASRNIEKLSYASRLQARKLISTAPTAAHPSGYIIASSDDLLNLFDADFGILSIHGETKTLGKLDQPQEALAMLEYLRLRAITSVITSQDVTTDFPDLKYPPGFQVIAGLLLVPLSVSGSDFIVFFRRGGVREVKWAGNPYEKVIREGTQSFLEPRKSFKTWSEMVIGKSREWTDEQIETAAVLCLVYGKFIEVWRQKEAALQSSKLTKILLANSAHEVRTPLNAIINYLEIALEGSLDNETRENLSKSHSASKSLIYVINDLLDLTKTEEGKSLIKVETFDLPMTIREATDFFMGDAKRKGLLYEITASPGLPQFVQGDQQRVRQIVSNITANAFQHTSTGFVRVTTSFLDITDDRVTVEISVEDSGVGMSKEKLDQLFSDLEQVTADNELLLLNEASEAEESDSGSVTDKGKYSEKRTLGLGLAIVARLIRNMDGQLRLKSQEGSGSRFVVQLSFLLPVEQMSGSERSLVLDHPSPPSSSAAAHPPEDEVTLVEKVSSLRAGPLSAKRSMEEVGSMRSFKSGSSNKSAKSHKSDVDRLIDAISYPLPIGDTEQEGQNAHGTGYPNQKAGGSRSARSSIAVQPKDGLRALRRVKTSEGGGHSLIDSPVGSEPVMSEKTPIKAVRMPDEFSSLPDGDRQATLLTTNLQSVAMGETENSPADKTNAGRELTALDAHNLTVLVAEDDPTNSRIIQKRLEKSGHQVHLTVNGEECASAYSDTPDQFDIVLMDIQMPIADGYTSTRMIRSYEKMHPEAKLSSRASLNGRIPIFAVSASLVERQQSEYADLGFDGWILKPIDFKRLNTLLAGIVEDDTRQSCLYEPGHWERGGWFHRTQPARNMGLTDKPQDLGCQTDGYSLSSDISNTSSESLGEITPMNEPRQQQPFIVDERPSSQASNGPKSEEVKQQAPESA